MLFESVSDTDDHLRGYRPNPIQNPGNPDGDPAAGRGRAPSPGGGDPPGPDTGLDSDSDSDEMSRNPEKVLSGQLKMMREATKEFGRKLALEKGPFDGTIPFKMIQFIQLGEEVLECYTIGNLDSDHMKPSHAVTVLFDNLLGMAKNLIRVERQNITNLMEDLDVFKDTVIKIFYKPNSPFHPYSVLNQIKQDETMSVKTYASAIATVGQMVQRRILADTKKQQEFLENRTYRNDPMLQKRKDPIDGKEGMPLFKPYSFVNPNYMNGFTGFLAGTERYGPQHRMATVGVADPNVEAQEPDPCEGGPMTKERYRPGWDDKRPRIEISTRVKVAKDTAPGIKAKTGFGLEFGRTTGIDQKGNTLSTNESVFDNGRWIKTADLEEHTPVGYEEAVFRIGRMNWKTATQDIQTGIDEENHTGKRNWNSRDQKWDIIESQRQKDTVEGRAKAEEMMDNALWSSTFSSETDPAWIFEEVSGRKRGPLACNAGIGLLRLIQRGMALGIVIEMYYRGITMILHAFVTNALPEIHQFLMENIHLIYTLEDAVSMAERFEASKRKRAAKININSFLEDFRDLDTPSGSETPDQIQAQINSLQEKLHQMDPVNQESETQDFELNAFQSRSRRPAQAPGYNSGPRFGRGGFRGGSNVNAPGNSGYGYLPPNREPLARGRLQIHQCDG